MFSFRLPPHSAKLVGVYHCFYGFCVVLTCVLCAQSYRDHTTFIGRGGTVSPASNTAVQADVLQSSPCLIVHFACACGHLADRPGLLSSCSDSPFANMGMVRLFVHNSPAAEHVAWFHFSICLDLDMGLTNLVYAKLEWGACGSPRRCLRSSWGRRMVRLEGWAAPCTCTSGRITSSAASALSASRRACFFHATCSDVCPTHFMDRNAPCIAWMEAESAWRRWYLWRAGAPSHATLALLQSNKPHPFPGPPSLSV